VIVCMRVCVCACASVHVCVRVSYLPLTKNEGPSWVQAVGRAGQGASRPLLPSAGWVAGLGGPAAGAGAAVASAAVASAAAVAAAAAAVPAAAAAGVEDGRSAVAGGVQRRIEACLWMKQAAEYLSVRDGTRKLGGGVGVEVRGLRRGGRHQRGCSGWQRLGGPMGLRPGAGRLGLVGRRG